MFNGVRKLQHFWKKRGEADGERGKEVEIFG
ncbi:hypothetical protein N183_30565 [Sinorhizobium sp. Sb3]|nr:hypothetical protein N183_30565 [Sinorhizobium sp. Sb3]